METRSSRRRSPHALPTGPDAKPPPDCDGCDESHRSTNDTLCPACRLYIDLAFADLPGAAA